MRIVSSRGAHSSPNTARSFSMCTLPAIFCTLRNKHNNSIVNVPSDQPNRASTTYKNQQPSKTLLTMVHSQPIRCYNCPITSYCTVHCQSDYRRPPSPTGRVAGPLMGCTSTSTSAPLRIQSPASLARPPVSRVPTVHICIDRPVISFQWATSA
jgi:hypothetical protein